MPVIKTFIESHEVDTNGRVIKRNFFLEYASSIRLSPRARVPSFQCSSKLPPGAKEMRERLTIRNQGINRSGLDGFCDSPERIFVETEPEARLPTILRRSAILICRCVILFSFLKILVALAALTGMSCMSVIFVRALMPTSAHSLADLRTIFHNPGPRRVDG
jgi:hypothetical protein